MKASNPTPAHFAGALARSFRRHRTVLFVALLWSFALHWWEGERIWDSHSPAFEPVRMMGVLDAWQHGIWDARWLSLFDLGYGYPIFSYHSPLFSWVGAAFLAATGLPVLSLKLAIMFFFLVGGLGCRTLAAHFWARPHACDFHAGDLAFTAWASATYLLIDIFVRGSLAEFAASCFAPWVIWGLWLLTANSRRYVAGASIIAVSLALLALSHNAVAVYMLMLLAVPLPLLLRPCGWRGWLSFGAGGAFAGGLSAFFAVSAALEKSFVRLENVIFRDVRDHFLRVEHLLALGQWNLNLSCQDAACTMPRHQGLLLPLALLGGAAAFRTFRTKRLRAKAAIFLVLAGLTLTMAMPPSVWLWDHVRILQYTQFPWRWLSLNSVMLALLVPAFGVALRLHGSEIAQRCYGVAVGAVLLLDIGLYGGPPPSARQWDFDPNPEPVLRDRARTAIGDEYGPIWRPTEYSHPVAAGELLAQDVPVNKAALPSSPWRWMVGTRLSDCHVIAGAHYFPAWRAYWSTHTPSPRQELRVEDASGLVAVTIPSGSPGYLELEFTNTPVRRALKILSASSLILGALLLLWLQRRERGDSSRAPSARIIHASGSGPSQLPPAEPVA